MDATCPCTRIYRTTGKVTGTERDSATPRDASSSETRSRSSFQSPTLVAISFYPAQFRDQDIVNPRHPIRIVKRDRSAEPFNARINGHPAKNSDSASFFSHVVGLEAVPREVTDVNAREMTNFASNPVIDETPKFVDLRISTINTADRLNSAFPPLPERKVGWITPTGLRLGIVLRKLQCTDRARQKRTVTILKNSEFETMNVFERENNDGIRLIENNSGTQLTKSIPLT